MLKKQSVSECASDLFRAVSERIPDSRQRASWNGLCRDDSCHDETVWCGSTTTCIRYFVIAEHAAYQAREYQIEPDVSAASYFYAMCPVVGVPAKVCHVHWESLQGDTSFLHVLEQMGCRTEEEPDGIRMYPPTEGFLGGVFDFSAFSDQALTLAAIACLPVKPWRLPESDISVIRNVTVLPRFLPI